MQTNPSQKHQSTHPLTRHSVCFRELTRVGCFAQWRVGFLLCIPSASASSLCLVLTPTQLTTTHNLHSLSPGNTLVTSSDALTTSSFLLLVAMPLLLQAFAFLCSLLTTQLTPTRFTTMRSLPHSLPHSLTSTIIPPAFCLLF